MTSKLLFLFLGLLVITGVVSGQRGTHSGVNNSPPRGNAGHLPPRGGGGGVSDGHRLITRALWRIFDALMEKKNHEELYGRMKFVENTLNTAMSTDTKLETRLQSMITSLEGYKDDMSYLKKEMDKLKLMDERVSILEEWQLRLERQRDEDIDDRFDGAQPGFSACPAPFEAIGGECMFVSMDSKRGWRDARRECARIGGDLSSPADIENLKNYLRELPKNRRPEYVWVGGSRTNDEKWIWSTGNQAGTPVDMSQNTWNEELPEGIGDCMGLYERAGYRAYDYTCEEKDYFVCQYFF